MSTKASPPTSTVKIKKELANDEIKDFAETAMNELLGWYGYDNVDRIDEQTKTTRIAVSGVNLTENNFRNDSNNSNSHQDTSGAQSHDSSGEDSRSPSSMKNCEKTDTLCGWCKRTVPRNSPEFLTTPEGPRYCSESCFTQSRRASFKRAKTCDWCRHIRHAVSYVDFQDGASQLQFCSDKCLNQYKMQIFCKETQAHLDMNPHLKDKGADTSSAGLITPDLWLRNCRSRSATPEQSDVSRSPTPTQKNATSQPAIHKPMISVAPPSKLLSRSQLMESTRQSPKHSRKKRFTRLNVNHSSIGHNGNSSSATSLNCNNNIPKLVADSTPSQTAPPKPCTFTNVQDLRMNVPSISPIDGVHPIRPPINCSFFSGLAPNTFNAHPPPFFNSPTHPRLFGLGSQQPIFPMPGADFTGQFSALGTTPPPVTVMVPYPIIVPLPIPIPIPLPIIDFVKAAELRKNGAIPPQKPEEKPNSEQPEEPIEPLDCSKSKILPIPSPEPSTKAQSSNHVEDHPNEFTEQHHNSDEDGEKECVPKLKITRLNSKRATINPPRELESSRPLRKRKRVIDCDYIKASKDFDDKIRVRK